MRSVDATLLAQRVPPYHGARGTRQQTNIQSVGRFLPAALMRYAIATPLRQAHFLAQVCEESWGMSDLKEEATGSEYEGRKSLGNTRPRAQPQPGRSPGACRDSRRCGRYRLSVLDRSSPQSPGRPRRSSSHHTPRQWQAYARPEGARPLSRQGEGPAGGGLSGPAVCRHPVMRECRPDKLQILTRDLAKL